MGNYVAPIKGEDLDLMTTTVYNLRPVINVTGVRPNKDVMFRNVTYGGFTYYDQADSSGNCSFILPYTATVYGTWTVSWYYDQQAEEEDMPEADNITIDKYKHYSVAF